MSIADVVDGTSQTVAIAEADSYGYTGGPANGTRTAEAVPDADDYVVEKQFSDPLSSSPEFMARAASWDGIPTQLVFQSPAHVGSELDHTPSRQHTSPLGR